MKNKQDTFDTSAPEPLAGRHGFVGHEGHADEFNSSWAGKTGFSLGVFEWVPRSSGRGLKPGPVKIRVKGLFSKAPAVYSLARELSAKLDAGETIGQKSISV